MATTIVGLNDAKAVKRWSAALFYDTARAGWWSSRMMAKGKQAMAPIQVLTELENDAGDTIHFDLFLQLNGEPTYGDIVREGNEEALNTKSDSISIDQVRYSVDTGGAMTRKRTLHDLRMRAKELAADYWMRLDDEYHFIYGSGARGINTGFICPLGFTGYANNALNAPDSGHIIYGDGTTKATLTSSGKMTRQVIEKANTKAATLGGDGSGTPQIRPLIWDGEERYVVVMHTFQEYDLRLDAGTSGWMEIQKAAAAAEGQKNPIFKGGLGMIGNTVLQAHPRVIRFSDYGSGSNVKAARALFLGRQALVTAFGSPGNGLRMKWVEKLVDLENRLIIGLSCIRGDKKVQFNSADFGVVSLDTAAVDPNA
jgi:N4-gp56 family major capsid protein